MSGAGCVRNRDESPPSPISPWVAIGHSGPFRGGRLAGRALLPRGAIFAAHTGNDNGGPGVANHCPARCVRTPTPKLILNLYPERTFFTHIVGCQPGNPHHLPFWNTWVEQAKTDPAAKRIVDAYLHRPAAELYDLRDDPHEMRNLAGVEDHAGTLPSLKRRLDQWRREQRDPELTGVGRPSLEESE